MNECTEPIVDPKGAEAFFRAMGCSSFHMSREYADRYDEYRALEISSELERQWTVSEFRKLRREIEDGEVVGDDLWSVHARLADLIWQRREIETVAELLRELLTVTHSIRDRVPDAWRILVAETIVGRGSIASGDGRCPERWRSA